MVLQRCSPATLRVLLLMETLENDRYGPQKLMSKYLGQSFEHITLYTYNGAAIFLEPSVYTVLHNNYMLFSFINPAKVAAKIEPENSDEDFSNSKTPSRKKKKEADNTPKGRFYSL